MKLIIGRHGESEPNSSTGYDRDRKLTEKGRLDIAKMASFISSTPFQVSQIFHSPYARTEETARIYSENLAIPNELHSAPELLPGNDYSDLCGKLTEFSNSDTILIIGHNPDISYFAAKLIRDESISRNFLFSPGTTIAVNIAKENFRNGMMIWMISPDFLKT